MSADCNKVDLDRGDLNDLGNNKIKIQQEEECGTQECGNCSDAEGCSTKAFGDCSHAEGSSTNAFGTGTHAEGSSTKAYGDYSHAEGVSTSAYGNYSHAEGNGTAAYAANSHTEGSSTKTRGASAHAEGVSSEANGDYSHAEGVQTKADGYASMTIGGYTNAKGSYSHAEGYSTTAAGSYAHSEGYVTNSNGSYSHAEGYSNTSDNSAAHAEGAYNTAKGSISHAEGYSTTASGSYAHTEGYSTVAEGTAAHAEGGLTAARGAYSHAEGYNTDTKSYTGSHIMGLYGDADENYSWFLGGGTSNNRALAAKISYTGNAYIKNTWNSGGVNYAEMFSAGCEAIAPGYFVTLNGEALRVANDCDEFLLGVTTDVPGFVANSMVLSQGQNYLAGNRAAAPGEEVKIIPEVKDKDGAVLIPEQSIKAPATTALGQPAALGTQFSAVAILGQVVVNDDGTCQVNGYCMPNQDGIATETKAGYRVMKRISDNQVLILFR